MHKLLFLYMVAVVTASLDYKTLPGLNYDTWWGAKDKQVDTTIRRFKIEFKDDMIKDLKYRLENRREFIPPLEGVAYNYGVNTDTLGYWLDYWANNYNFTEREAYMNQFPHYKTNIQGLDMHFIWIVPEVPKCKIKIPLLLMHGYPGSICEFYETIPLLTAVDDDKDFVFELVVPSLPGFGYSDSTRRQGLGAAEMAFILKNLMNRLGHEKFYIQGGDWGAHIGSNMATFFQDEILGYHTNMGLSLMKETFNLMSIASVYPAVVMPTDLIKRLYPLQESLKYMMQESGYFHIQATKPDAIGVCANESPTCLFTWIAQFISTASRRTNINDTRGGLDMYTPEQLLDNVMVYWTTNTITTAFRIYAETFNMRNKEMDYINIPTTVPTVVVQAPDEILYMPPVMLNIKFENLVSVDVLDEGGHFLSWEAPELFAQLVYSGIDKIRKFR